MVDVSHFQPNEISVKTTDTNIIVHGKLVPLSLFQFTALIIKKIFLNAAKHEERRDEFGGVTRE